MTPDAEKLQAINNDLAAVLMRHGACGIIVYGCAAGTASAQILTPNVIRAPRLDGTVEEGIQVPKATWDDVQRRLLKVADTIRRARGW